MAGYLSVTAVSSPTKLYDSLWVCPRNRGNCGKQKRQHGDKTHNDRDFDLELAIDCQTNAKDKCRVKLGSSAVEKPVFKYCRT